MRFLSHSNNAYQKSGIGASSRCGYNLSATSVQGFFCNLSIQHFKFHISNSWNFNIPGGMRDNFEKFFHDSRSSQSGPSLVAHWNPWIIDSRTVLNRFLSTSEGNVSSSRIFGPFVSGPKAQIERAASKSQSYLVWKKSPSCFLNRPICASY